MPNRTARIESKRITDWASFHSVFAEELGFPDFYGHNMNAWIDCLTYFDDGMTRFELVPGELLHLKIVDSEDFAHRLPEIYQALIECSTFVNRRRFETGEPPILALVLS